MTDYETVENRVKRNVSGLFMAELAQQAVNDVLDQMTDDELRILAYTDQAAWPTDFSHKWSALIDQTEAILHQAEKAGVVIDEL